MFPLNFKDLEWNSYNPYAILLFFLLFTFYSIINIRVPFQKREMKKRERILMIILHSIVLLVIVIFSSSQYEYMNLINVVINILMIASILYLITFQSIKLK